MAGKPSRTGPAGSGRLDETATRTRGRSAETRVAEHRSSPGRRPEIVALALFGLAAFLIFILVAGESGGFVGVGVRAALEFLFGRLGFLVPLVLLVTGVSVVVDIRLWRAFWVVGAGVFLFGLFLLWAAGFPPVGSHGDAYVVHAEYAARSGVLGEGLYAGFHSLAGGVGVAILGWTTVLAGFSAATGLTVRRLGRGTRRAAQAVKEGAEWTTLTKRRRMPLADDEHMDGLAADFSNAVGRATARQRGDAYSAGFGGVDPFGGEFDEWADGSHTATRSPLAPVGAAGTSAVLIDGARSFSDIYVSDSPMSSVAAGGPPRGEARASVATAQLVDMAGAASTATSVVSEQATSDAPSNPEVGRQGLMVEADAGPHVQQALPGLGRAPGRVVLASEETMYVLPESDLLRKSAPSLTGRGGAERDTAAVLIQALSQFGVEARVIGMVVGPRVTRYELQLAPGIKVAKVSGLKDDLAYALASTEIRILAPIPGKSAVGVEVPNQRPDFVTLGDIYREFPKTAGPLMVWLGKDISGKAVYTDLSRLPHLLIAGTTGSGKSGCVNCLVSSILLRSNPEQVRMIMIDPKKVELSHYDRIPHLLVPVVTNMKDAAGVLHNVAKEMEDRYELMELERARNLPEMNKARARRGERGLPYILVVIDELADLMMVSPQEVEDHVIRLAQKSRAVGIHLVVATQRPSADVITGMIKANIPSRIAFAVSSQTDSRVILDVNGAEALLGMGDMLFRPLGSNHLQRVQGAYITEEEIALLVNHWRHQAEPEFREELLRRPTEPKKSEDDYLDPDSDDLLPDAAQLVIETGGASVSMLQRRLRVGYTRAGRLIDMLERRGIVGPWEGSKPRQLLVDPDEIEQVMAILRAEERMGEDRDGE